MFEFVCLVRRLFVCHVTRTHTHTHKTVAVVMSLASCASNPIRRQKKDLEHQQTCARDSVLARTHSPTHPITSSDPLFLPSPLQSLWHLLAPYPLTIFQTQGVISPASQRTKETSEGKLACLDQPFAPPQNHNDIDASSKSLVHGGPDRHFRGPSKNERGPICVRPPQPHAIVSHRLW